MRLKWNPNEASFEAEFQDFQGDLAAVKAAGFKTTGPPEWKWYSLKTGPLDKLRQNRPASGLTILEDALVEYNRIKAQETQKAALLAELKAAKKKHNPLTNSGDCAIPDGQEFGYHCIPDAESSDRIAYVAPVHPGPYCCICKGPVHFYELQNPPTCLWCEIQLDKCPNLF